MYLQRIATQQAKTNSTRIPDPITVTAVCVPIPNWAPPLLSVNSSNFSSFSSLLESPSQRRFIYHIVDTIMLMVHKVWPMLYFLMGHPFSEINRKLNLGTRHCNIYFLWLSFSKKCLLKKVPHKNCTDLSSYDFQVLNYVSSNTAC